MDGNTLGQLNYFAIVAAAVAAFVVGGVWYSATLFGKAWQSETGLSDEQLAARNPGVVFGVSFVLTLVASFVFAMFLGPRPAFPFALSAGLSAGVAWVATSFGINYLFESRSLRLFWINAGYHVAQYTAMGAILGLWH
jgi:hypothetical protein